VTYNPPYAGGENNHAVKKVKSEPIYEDRTGDVCGQSGQVAAILALFAPQEGLGSIQRGHTSQGRVTVDIVGHLDGKLVAFGYVDLEQHPTDDRKSLVVSRFNSSLDDRDVFAQFSGAFWRRLEILGYLQA
jgi:hypothetical protein